MPSNNKKRATKKITTKVASVQDWNICYGELKRGLGRPPKSEHLFKVVGEKIPFSALISVKKHLKQVGHTYQGVYVAHDSMGCPRYVGRGNIFDRLAARKKAQTLELEYFSFYVMSEKKHEREVETLVIKAAGFLLEFNDKKKRIGISAGDIRDYEAGTYFYERQYKKGKPAGKKKPASKTNRKA